MVGAYQDDSRESTHSCDNLVTRILDRLTLKTTEPPACFLDHMEVKVGFAIHRDFMMPNLLQSTYFHFVDHLCDYMMDLLFLQQHFI